MGELISICLLGDQVNGCGCPHIYLCLLCHVFLLCMPALSRRLNQHLFSGILQITKEEQNNVLTFVREVTG